MPGHYGKNKMEMQRMKMKKGMALKGGTKKVMLKRGTKKVMKKK